MLVYVDLDFFTSTIQCCWSIWILTQLHSTICFIISDLLHPLVFCTNNFHGCRGRDHMVVTTTCAISTYHHYRYEFEPCSWWGVLDTTLCD